MKADDFLEAAQSADDFLGDEPPARRPRRTGRNMYYVAPDSPTNPIVPRQESVLQDVQMAVPTFTEDRQNRALVDQAIGANQPKPRGPRPVRDAKAVAQDLYSILGNTGVQLVKPFVDVPNIVLGGALDPAVQFLQNAGRAANAAASPTTNYDRETLSLMPEGAALEKAAHLISNPALAANMAIPSAASMAMPLAVAKGASILFPKTAMALGDKFATGSAVGANALMNAGDTFGQTQADIAGRALAALGSGASSALVGKATGGGLEGQLARRGGIPTIGAAARSVGTESAQEFGENFGNQLAQDTGEGQPLNLAKAIDEGTIGALLAPIIAGPVNLAQFAGNQQRRNANLLAGAIEADANSMPARPDVIDNGVRSQAAPVAQQPVTPATPAPPVPQLPYDPAVQAPPAPMVVDSQGNARPMSADEFLQADQARQSDQELGITPDVRRAQEARSEPTAPEPVPSDLLERLRAAGWTPPGEGNNPSPDPEVVQRMEQDFERLYQEDTKQAIRQRLGIDQPDASARPTAQPKERPSAFRAFLRDLGIAPELAGDVTGERGFKANSRMPGTFRKGGLQLDEVVTRAVERGFLTDAQVASTLDNGGTNALVEMIRAELRGERQVSSEMAGDEARQALDGEAIEGLQRQAEAIGLDATGLDGDQINLALKRIERRRVRAQGRMDVSREAQAERQAMRDADDLADLDDDDIPWNNDSNTSTEDAMRALGFSEQEITDAIAQESRATPESGAGRGAPGQNGAQGTQRADAADPRSEAGQRPAVVREGDARYRAEQPSRGEPDDFSLTSTPYDQDLFGNAPPVPQPSRAGGAARPDVASVRRDAQPEPELSDTPATPGQYYVNTIVGTEVSRELGAARINSPAEAAQATRYLYRSAVERMDGIVTDKDGKPLAVVGGFKGALAQTAVYPATLMGEAIRIPGAARIWFSHNHPSGKARLSSADEMLNKTVTDVFKGSGIEPMGILAVTGDSFGYADQWGAVHDVETIPPSTSSISVPAIERQLAGGTPGRKVSDPDTAMAVAKVYYGRAGEPGLILMNSRNEVIAWVPIVPNMMGALRDTGGAAAIYRAVSEANAGAAIIVHGGELDTSPGLPKGVTMRENIAAALQKLDVLALDAINVTSGLSIAQTGLPIARGPMFSRPKPAPLKDLVDTRRRLAVLKSLRECLA